MKLGLILALISSVSFAGENYKIVSDIRVSDDERRVNVLIDRKLSDGELERIAKKIKLLDAHDYEYIFIGYKLSCDPQGRYWALTNYDPDLLVETFY